jgi:lysophospholipase L1-like esterase
VSKTPPALQAGVAAAVLLAVTGCGLLSDDEGAEPPGDDSNGTDESSDLVVVGDSFPEQARDQLLALADEHSLDVAVTAFGGTAICDWWDQIEDYAAGTPDAVVLAFAGNDSTCMTGGSDRPLASQEEGLGAEEAAGLYREDLESALDRFRPTGAEMYVVLPPPVGEPYEERASAMRDMYRETQADHPELTIIDSANHLDPDGKGFQASLPCESWDECPEGETEVQVRDDDRIHLTPAGGERYARAILEGVGLAA